MVRDGENWWNMTKILELIDLIYEGTQEEIESALNRLFVLGREDVILFALCVAVLGKNDFLIGTITRKTLKGFLEND